ncbi:MAG TPA: GNAT family N-acetyltransferase, partial [Gammaproteobacteria bacterium]
QHFLLYAGDELIAGIPAYIKTNSFGEFVFDHPWAAAYARAGLDYYPKLVLAVPFTPVTGKRLLIKPEADPNLLAQYLIPAVIEFARDTNLSGVHCLFTCETDRHLLQQSGFLLRLDYQYHWHNSGYNNFEHYLSFMRSHKRKNIRQERRRVTEQGIHFNRLYGHELNAAQLDIIHRFYHSTFLKKGNYPALTRDFFESISTSMGPALVVMLAEENGQAVAASVDFRSDSTLYGRYWGCDRMFDALHFEACYYQGIEYCIEHKLRSFEPGAQGEHKIARGFLPTATWSAHWLSDRRFHAAIADYLQRETAAMQQQRRELDQLSPFRDTPIID